MKKSISMGILLFCTGILFGQIYPVETIKNNGASGKRINLVFIGDGYRSTEQTKYINDVNKIANAMFDQSPFKEYQNFFNVYAIKVPSVESGAKHPGTATDVTEPETPITNPNNIYGSSFDASNIHRLLVPANSAAILTAMTNNFPEYDQIFVVVNSDVYGGSGGFFATSSTNAAAGEIAIHEIGHSFAGLGDEYWFNCSETKNRTANNDPLTIKWKNWLVNSDIGIHLIEGSSPNCYRPHPNCKMKVLGVPFCAVCREGFIDKIYSLVSPIDNFTPQGDTVGFSGSSMNFALGLILPQPNTLKVEWVLNGTAIAANVSNVNILSTALNNGNNTLTAKVTDGTPQSRVYQPAASGYLNSVKWTIKKQTSPVTTPNQIDKIRYEIYPNPVQNLLGVHVSSLYPADLELSLFDLQGRRLMTATKSAVDEVYEQFDVAPLAAGTYVLQIKMGDALVEKNIVKQ